jgi:hypothetical protein
MMDVQGSMTCEPPNATSLFLHHISAQQAGRRVGEVLVDARRFQWGSQTEMNEQLREIAAYNRATRDNSTLASLPGPYDGPFDQDDAFSTIMQWLGSRAQSVRSEKHIRRSKSSV